MIDFNGEISGDCKKFLINRHRVLQIKAQLITFTVFSIPTILLAILWRPMIALFMIPVSLVLIFAILPPTKQDQKTFVPKRVYIDLNERTIIQISEKAERFHMIEDVWQVEDYGEWYYFIFKLESRDHYFICQKNLLISGSIEQFEELFAEKIIRKF